MLSHLTFRQVRNIFHGILHNSSGSVVRCESGFVIEGCSFKELSKIDIEEIVYNVCECLGRCTSSTNHIMFVEDDMDPLSIKKIEIDISYGNRPGDKIVVVITYNNDNDENQLDINGCYTQKIAIWY